jgi:hypothetical protein
MVLRRASKRTSRPPPIISSKRNTSAAREADRIGAGEQVAALERGTPDLGVGHQ